MHHIIHHQLTLTRISYIIIIIIYMLYAYYSGIDKIIDSSIVCDLYIPILYNILYMQSIINIL